MKRLFPILLTLLTLTACPQAGQLLGPSNANVTASKTGAGDSPSAETPPDPTPLPEETPRPEATPPPAPPTEVSFNNPIEPKSDTPTVGGECADYVRLRYGDGFATILNPEAEAADKIPVAANGEIYLSAVAESRKSTNAPWKGSVDSVVRMVFLPSDASATSQYCDTNVLLGDATQVGGNVLFSGVSAGMGSLNFLHLSPYNIALQKAQVNQSSNPISLCSSGWKPWSDENTLNSNWMYMGSMETPVQFRSVTTRPAAHQTTSRPILKP